MNSQPDVLIIGGGVAGSTAATLLARQGIQVVLVDRWATYPECFKAEKIESDQADLYRKFRLMDSLLPHTGSIHEILRAQAGRVIRRVPTEQYGIFYHDMVNALRGAMPASVGFHAGRVESVETAEDRQIVHLSTGEVIHPRLVVLASGTGSDLWLRMGLSKRVIQAEQSFAAGFNLERLDGSRFPFDSITYYPSGSDSRIAYLTLFWIGSTMRANLFACWSNNEERTRQFVRSPDAEIARWFPQLSQLTGPMKITSKVETGRIDLFQVIPPASPGVVLIADAFQSCCPITGTGLTKVLTDVDVLCHENVAAWLASPGMAAEKLASFYKNPRKQEVDRLSLEGARYARQIATDRSLGWRLRRTQRHWSNRLSETLDHFMFTRNATA